VNPCIVGEVIYVGRSFVDATAYHKFTENAAPAFGSTLSATLDAFQGVRPYVSGSAINDYLFKAWDENPVSHSPNHLVSQEHP